MHPRPGLVNEYLSDDWFDLFRYSVEKGKRLGIDIWIYDENSYPSGFAGGHVPAVMPESYNRGQGLVSEKATSIPADLRGCAYVLRKTGDGYEDIAFRPYELDVTEFMRPGTNRVEVVVTGSLKNLLGPHHNDPAPGVAGPWHWKNILGPVPGEKYQLLDYGLTNDFEVIRDGRPALK